MSSTAEPAQASGSVRPLPAPPRTRKAKPKKAREARYEQEIQYNLSYNFRGAGSRRHAQPPTMQEEADLTPPAYEAGPVVSHQSGPVSSAHTIASLPVSTHTARLDTFSANSASFSLSQRHPERHEYRVELVDLEPSERWELDRCQGISLDERVKRHKLRTETTVLPGLLVPHRTRLASQPTVPRGPGSQARFLTSQLSLRIPERDRYEDDQNQDNSDLSTPPTPKHHRMPSIPGSPSRFFHGHGHTRSHSPQPSSTIFSLLLNSGPKLFHRKGKERALSESLEEWEVLERSGSEMSNVNGSVSSREPSVVGMRGAEPSPTSRTPHISSLVPWVPAHGHNLDLPIFLDPCLGPLPTRSTAERIVTPPSVRAGSFSRNVSMRSIPTYSSLFPSGPPTTLLNRSQSLPAPITPTTQSSDGNMVDEKSDLKKHCDKAGVPYTPLPDFPPSSRIVWREKIEQVPQVMPVSVFG